MVVVWVFPASVSLELHLCVFDVSGWLLRRAGAGAGAGTLLANRRHASVLHSSKHWLERLVAAAEAEAEAEEAERTEMVAQCLGGKRTAATVPDGFVGRDGRLRSGT
jgi:hypothetical protein